MFDCTVGVPGPGCFDALVFGGLSVLLLAAVLWAVYVAVAPWGERDA